MTIPVIVVPCRKPAMTSNEQRRATWPIVRKAKQEMGTAVWAAAKRARIAPQAEQIAVRVTQYPPTRQRRDVDSLGPFVIRCPRLAVIAAQETCVDLVKSDVAARCWNTSRPLTHSLEQARRG